MKVAQAIVEILKREDMDEAQGTVYDEAEASGGPVGGPSCSFSTCTSAP